MTKTTFDVAALAKKHQSSPPQTILELALAQFDQLAISFSGADDVVLIDMAAKMDANINVFSLDTGRLHEETYRFIERVRDHYNINIEILFPEPVAVENLVKEKGLYSFYQDGHQECCSIRKVLPLKRKLGSIAAWITGQRKDQSLATRSKLATIEQDKIFSRRERPLIKFNPLANWRLADVWDYINNNKVPYNRLHEQGYISIGCAPCTRAILPGQHEREGRWWWENATKKECGLHYDIVK